MTLNLYAPTSTEPITNFASQELFGDDQWDTTSSFTPDPTTVEFSELGESLGAIERYYQDTDMKTYATTSEIRYVYVNGDVTITRAAQIINEDGRDTAWAAIDLELKTGWNLVQIDRHETEDTKTAALKIADKEIPWKAATGHVLPDF
jgi:hypothetical protein